MKKVNVDNISFVEYFPTTESRVYEIGEQRVGGMFSNKTIEAVGSRYGISFDVTEVKKFFKEHPHLFREGNKVKEYPKVVIHLNDGSTHTKYFQEDYEAKGYYENEFLGYITI